MTPPAPSVLDTFKRYDRNGSNGIEVDELRALLKDLGLLKGLSHGDAATWVAAQFALADKKTKDGKLDLTEFTRYYAKVAAPKLLEALSAEMPAEVERLQAAFEAFASFGAPRGAQSCGLDGARFIKMCRETGLVDGRLTTTDADLAFASVKDRQERRITFEQFLDALELLAAKKGQPLGEMVTQVAGSSGPELHATQAASVKLHDDRSTYTGTHARRGSDASEGSRQSRGGSAASTTRRFSAASRAASLATPGASLADSQDVESRDSLKEAFLAFAGFGTGSSPAAAKARPEMDSKQFMKLCRESGVLGGRVTSTAADLAFIAKAKPLGARKIGYKQFLEAVEQLAHERVIPKEELFAKIAACRGPRINSTLGAPSLAEQQRVPVRDEGGDAVDAVAEAVGKLSVVDSAISISVTAA